MSCAVASALADMVTPQIIRVAVDQVIGSAGTEGLSLFVPEMLAAAEGGRAEGSGTWKTPLRGRGGMGPGGHRCRDRGTKMVH